jgi:hypothetical protein
VLHSGKKVRDRFELSYVVLQTSVLPDYTI